jgi:hypothetical protein
MLFFHGGYVAFAFAVLLFGALAYRQVLDNLDLRRLKFGEERASYVSAPGILVSIGACIITVLLMGFLYSFPHESIFLYALPLILLVQNTQMFLRLVFQRTLLTTMGIVVRPALRIGLNALHYDRMITVSFRSERLWTAVTVLDSSNGPVTFRIFSFSVSPLQQILRTNSRAEIFTVGTGLRNPSSSH